MYVAGGITERQITIQTQEDSVKGRQKQKCRETEWQLDRQTQKCTETECRCCCRCRNEFPARVEQT